MRAVPEPSGLLGRRVRLTAPSGWVVFGSTEPTP